jgi:hypothetical protein
MSNLESASVVDICARVKHLGYTVAGKIRLYGEELEVVSDPFPEADGVAVQVRSRKNPTVRKMRIPATVLQSVKGKKPAKAA